MSIEEKEKRENKVIFLITFTSKMKINDKIIEFERKNLMIKVSLPKLAKQVIKKEKNRYGHLSRIEFRFFLEISLS